MAIPSISANTEPAELIESLESAESSDSPHDGALLSLQIAEYETLMSRGNYFMSFYVGITSVVVAVIVLVLPEWLRSKEFGMLWLGGVAIQLALHMYGSYVEEDYLLVVYLENDLREAVIKNIPRLSHDSFWQYEPFLSRFRVHENWWSEWLLPGAVLFAFAIGMFLRRSNLRQDRWWIVVNAILLIVLLVRTSSRVRLRQKFVRRKKLAGKAA